MVRDAWNLDARELSCQSGNWEVVVGSPVKQLGHYVAYA